MHNIPEPQNNKVLTIRPFCILGVLEFVTDAGIRKNGYGQKTKDQTIRDFEERANEDFNSAGLSSKGQVQRNTGGSSTVVSEVLTTNIWSDQRGSRLRLPMTAFRVCVKSSLP